MGINPLRERWARGEVASCLWFDIASPVSVEVPVKLPYDAFALVSVSDAAKLMIKAAGDVWGQVFPGRV